MTGKWKTSYAVVWREDDGAVRAGKLVLGRTRLRLETGAPGGRLTVQSFRYDGLVAVTNAAPAERIQGQPTAVLERPGRGRLAIATVGELGSVREIVERLSVSLQARVDA